MKGLGDSPNSDIPQSIEGGSVEDYVDLALLGDVSGRIPAITSPVAHPPIVHPFLRLPLFVDTNIGG